VERATAGRPAATTLVSLRDPLHSPSAIERWPAGRDARGRTLEDPTRCDDPSGAAYPHEHAGPARDVRRLSHVVGKTCERAGIDGLTFHDLRGTAVVRLAIAGASVVQIAAVTGHSLKDVEGILDAHYLGRDIQLAEAAVLKLEARTKL
jgi:integrase